MSFSTIPLTINKDSAVLTDKAQEFFDSFKSKGNAFSPAPTVLAGSGISLWQPSGLPSGRNFTRAMYAVLFEENLKLPKAKTKLLKKIFGETWSEDFAGMPFEHLMECCPSEEKANLLINQIYTSRQPNPVHEALADGLRLGAIHSIITTNYDCCIDAALDKSGAKYAKVITGNDAEKFSLTANSSCYYKIHGSTEPGLESTPMFNLKHEGLLEPHKRKLLGDLIANRSLVLIGYSGLDFEICPELERSELANIIWNDLYTEPPSISAKRLLEKKGGYLIYGDMLVFIQNWLGISYLPEKTENKVDIVESSVKEIFSEEEISLWRVKTLNSLGLPSLVFKALQSSNISSRNFYFTSIHRGRAYFHAGKYKTARKNFKAALKDAFFRRNFIQLADGALETSDAYRSYGAPIRAYLFTWIVSWLELRELETKKLIKQVLIIKDFSEITKSLKKLSLRKDERILPLKIITKMLNFTGEKLHSFVRRKLIDCARKSLETGNWIDFQQTALIAEGLDIDISDTAAEEYYNPPAAAEGYRHLGYYIPQTMVFYDRWLRYNQSPAERTEMVKEWKRHVRICKRMGINSSLWKILALSSSEKIKNESHNIFKLCEYGYFKRFFDSRKFTAQ